MKKYRLAVIWGTCVLVGILALLVLLLTSQNLTTAYSGFAVDSDGNIYLGRDSQIYVMTPEGETLRTIDARSTKAYRFTIKKDTLFLLAGTKLYKLDLYGEQLGEPVDYYALQSLQRPSFPTKQFVSDNGTGYVLRSPFLRTTIYRQTSNGIEPVFRMPTDEYAARLIVVAMFISGFIVIPVQIIVALRVREDGTP